MFSYGVCIKGTVKETVGPMAEPVLIGGEIVRPGDVVCADADGVVVVRCEDAADVVRRSQERIGAEEAYIAVYRSGKSTVEVSDLAAVREAKGLVIDAWCFPCGPRSRRGSRAAGC
ncbi:RraA family protein [Streptomyces fulvoviolaceus]|uniref:RraA family protein n=1 Tax=Streptomyces fulvoviolaceus TaxID=285535 RepID=UPI0021BE91C9|nr:hypothetical protein [Streptomyces fulvoviolaceus]MCT9080101.1 hypothetical protein [Streptomyces fulvoviolaceus]